MTVKITINAKTAREGFRKALQEIKTRFGTEALKSRVFRRALDAWGAIALDGEIQKQLANKALARRTGGLANATFVKTNLKGEAGSLAVEIQSNVPYARIQETGGTIRAKDKLLSIPLPRALTKAGVLRNTAAELRAKGNTFVQRSRAGNLLIFQRGKKKSRTSAAELIPLFVLKREVVIPASHWATISTDEALPALAGFIRDAFDREA